MTGSRRGLLKLLSDRRQQLVEQRIAAVNQLHQLLQELIPGGASRRLTATAAREMLARIRPRDQVGKARKLLALEHLGEVADLDAKLKAMAKRSTEVLAEHPSTVAEICGLGSSHDRLDSGPGRTLGGDSSIQRV